MFCENCPKHVLTTYFQGIDMTFPYDESIFDCYKERETCKNRDLQGEVIMIRTLIALYSSEYLVRPTKEICTQYLILFYFLSTFQYIFPPETVKIFHDLKTCKKTMKLDISGKTRL